MKNLEIKSKEQIINKKIGFYFNYSLGSPPLEINLSLLDQLLSQNNKIILYLCDSNLNSCTANPLKNKNTCINCKLRVKHGLELIRKRNYKIKHIDISKASNTITSNKHIKPLELGVMSSLASILKVQSYNDLNKFWIKVYNRMLNDSIRLFNFFDQEIHKEKFDFIFMFNGRFGDVKPVLEATRKNKIGYGLTEIKKSINEVVFINELIHSVEGNTARALKNYNLNIKKAKSSAEIFFTKKILNQKTGDPVYTKNQKKGFLNERIINSKNIISIFTTTDDEYKFIGAEWDGHVPDDQSEEIRDLLQKLKNTEYTIVVKMHPNQKTVSDEILLKYTSLSKDFENVIVEDPFSKSDSYELMKLSCLVINFASTIGVEATYAGKIVIGIGDTTFSKMNISYKVNSGIEAAELILNNKLYPKPKKGAIIWGAYLMDYSDKLELFKKGKKGYFINNKKINVPYWRKLLEIPGKIKLRYLQNNLTLKGIFKT